MTYHIEYTYLQPQMGWLEEDFEEFPSDEQAIAAVEAEMLDAVDIQITSILEVSE